MPGGVPDLPEQEFSGREGLPDLTFKCENVKIGLKEGLNEGVSDHISVTFLWKALGTKLAKIGQTLGIFQTRSDPPPPGFLDFWGLFRRQFFFGTFRTPFMP